MGKFLDSLFWFINGVLLRIVLFNIVLGGGGAALILLGLWIDIGQHSISPDVQETINRIATVVAFVGIIATAASIYIKGNLADPVWYSRWIAGGVIAGCVACIVYMLWFSPNHHISDNILSGFTLIGLAGALFRLQPNPFKPVKTGGGPPLRPTASTAI